MIDLYASLKKRRINKIFICQIFLSKSCLSKINLNLNVGHIISHVYLNLNLIMPKKLKNNTKHVNLIF